MLRSSAKIPLQGRGPFILFLHIRRTGLLTLVIVVSALVFFASIPVSYGIPPLNGVRETPVYRALPVVLGTACAAAVNPLSSDQELLRGHRARKLRTVLPVALLILAIVAISSAGFIFARIYPDQEVIPVIAPMLTSTSIFASIGVISAAILPKAWQVAPTGIVFLILIGFGHRTFTNPQIWNILYEISTPIVAATVALLLGAFITVQRRY